MSKDIGLIGMCEEPPAGISRIETLYLTREQAQVILSNSGIGIGRLRGAFDTAADATVKLNEETQSFGLTPLYIEEYKRQTEQYFDRYEYESAGPTGRPARNKAKAKAARKARKRNR